MERKPTMIKCRFFCVALLGLCGALVGVTLLLYDYARADHLLRIAAQCTVKIPERGKRLVWQGALRQIVITCVEHHRRRLKA